MPLFCAGPCSGISPITDSVRVDLSAIAAAAEAEQLRAEQEEAERLAREQEEEARRLAEQEAEQRAEEERQRQEEEERMRLEEQRAREEAERLEEERRRAAEERARLEREERARREEAERQARLKEERERKEALDAWCLQHGFADISAPRRSGCAVFSAATTYPLHWAAELRDSHIVGLLLKAGVDTRQKNSAGKTAAQVAQKKDKNGSHQEVRRLLAGGAAPQAGGA